MISAANAMASAPLAKVASSAASPASTRAPPPSLWLLPLSPPSHACLGPRTKSPTLPCPPGRTARTSPLQKAAPRPPHRSTPTARATHRETVSATRDLRATQM
ncbi:hypothetical protein FRC06_004479, partial [Ceratobasidium sp. 370]